MASIFSRHVGILATGVLALFLAHPCAAQEKAKDKAPAELSLNDLSMEVSALQALHQFKFTPAQMEQLLKWTDATAQKERKREDGKASKEIRDKMQELSTALISASDDDVIDELTEQLGELRETEMPVFEDDVEVTEPARKRATEAFRLLRPGQLVAYLAPNADEFPDPLHKLIDGMEKVRGLTGAEWKAKRDEIGDEVSLLVAGLDSAKAERVSDQVLALLIRARGLSEADFQKQQAELDKAARAVIGDLNPVVVIQHYVENELATLLSNPRLQPALRARLK